jgi:hypothetical protein
MPLPIIARPSRAGHVTNLSHWSHFWNATDRVLNAEHRMIALNAETYSLGRLWARGWIERSRIARGMEAVSRYNGLVAKRGIEVVRQVILGALRKGATRPYPDLAPPKEVTVWVEGLGVKGCEVM